MSVTFIAWALASRLSYVIEKRLFYLQCDVAVADIHIGYIKVIKF